MKVLVIGSGGREHTLVWKLNHSKKVSKIYCAPGNAGTASLAENIAIEADKVDDLLEFVIKQQIDLTVVGPEVPLTMGIADKFAQYGLKLFGPTKNGAMLEGSKVYAKEFMEKYDIPTAPFTVFNNRYDALEYVSMRDDYPLVIKADGLAAGKGVLICKDVSEANDAINAMMKDQIFGSAGNRIIVEDFVKGTEISILAFVSGETIAPMVTAKDYKRAGDGDSGLNTGGMGAISPNPLYNDKLEKLCRERVFLPTLIGLQREGIDFRGVLYFGLMFKHNSVSVLEYNVRFGDPEAQVVLPRMKSDLLDVLIAVIDRKLDTVKIKWDKKSAATVVLASGGYPGSYEKGKIIQGLNDIEDATAFQAGTSLREGNVVTDGGRVLAVTAMDENLKKALSKSYLETKKISFENMYYRKDIGK